MKRILLSAAVVTGLLSACSQQTPKSQTAADVKDPLVENMDTTVNPAVDFFAFSNGRWVKNNPIPSNEKSWGIWTLVQNETFDRVKGISEEAGKTKAAVGTPEQKIGDFYFTGMDTATIEQQGVSPLKPEFDRISAIRDKQSLLQAIAYYQTIGVDPLFGAYIMQDEKKSDEMSLHLYQGGLGLPERDYYFKNDERTKNIRAEYVKHIARMLTLSGTDSVQAAKDAQSIMKFETSLAKASRKLEDLRDPYANYNKMAVTSLRSLSPSVDWVNMLTDMHIRSMDSVVVGQPEFFKEVERTVKSESIDNWKSYLRWQLVASYAPYLNSAIDKENFHFHGTIMTGVSEQRPRWKRVLATEEGALGDLLGQLYVKKYVSPEVKKRYQELTNNIIEAYREHIKALDWMSDSTKAKALVKLNSITTKVAYPDKWKDYSNLTIDRSSYIANVMRANQWAYDYQVAKLGKPVDRTEWDMTPQTYNAYYNPSNNEIVLPAAAFIIPGMPDTLADDAVIYGYAGASTIGHELTHGFDDQGRQFDEKGNLVNWWTPSDEKEFAARASRIINQFENFKVLDSLHVNGTATQGENIADLGGVVLGYSAFAKTQQFKEGKKIGGLTPEQRFFMGYALSWLGKARDQSLAMQVMTDVHSPNFLRVNGPVANVPEFYKAFNVKPGDPMYMPDSLRVKIW